MTVQEVIDQLMACWDKETNCYVIDYETGKFLPVTVVSAVDGVDKKTDYSVVFHTMEHWPAEKKLHWYAKTKHTDWRQISDEEYELTRHLARFDFKQE